jgi:glycosyltransferase involved in cell wall biosynthesis
VFLEKFEPNTERDVKGDHAGGILDDVRTVVDMRSLDLSRKTASKKSAKRGRVDPVASFTATSNLKRIAILGNHLPRQCGIATFTTDLSKAISSEFSSVECFVLAMNDAGKHYAYPDTVRFEIGSEDLVSYRRAADFINVSAVDVLSVQHEYGIFGGKAGAHLFALLHELSIPIVTTLHTILPEPNPQQLAAMDELLLLSERVVIMSTHGAKILREVHSVSMDKIDIVPHGIPCLPGAEQSRRRLGLEGKSILLTFGLLSPDKGIEHVIDCLPSILSHCPDAVYIVLGATHPHVKERFGETYRVMLENRARKLKVDSNTIFFNRFVSQDELNAFLSAADIYITPYLQPDQITSGTLAYAVGSGKAAISTPYTYAKELLANGRGTLVPWPKDDPNGIAEAVISLIGDEEKRTAFRLREAEADSSMLWPNVAESYMRTFERARIEYAGKLRSVFPAKTQIELPFELPDINIDHVRLLSDHTGILQHAAFGIPRYADGYCLDDNARALLLMTLLQDTGVEDMRAVHTLESRYLAFVCYAFDNESGRFRNLMSYSRQWLDEQGSEDSHGRALWGLGTLIGRFEDPGRRGPSVGLFRAAIPAVDGFTSPRAWAYAILGLDRYLRAFEEDVEMQSAFHRTAFRLFELFSRTSTPMWPWFEDSATYCNARLSQALLAAGSRMNRDDMIADGLHSLHWLLSTQCSKDGDEYFSPIGSNGFYEKDGIKSEFDQQPVEACGMVSACLTAQRSTGDVQWAKEARRVFNWYLGHNELRQSLYEPALGACRDGLHPDRMNENMGAESTLSFLTALVEMRSVTQSTKLFCVNPDKGT